MIETNKIRINKTIFNNLLIIIQDEKENSKFIGQYTIEKHQSIIESKNEEHLSVFDKSDNSLIGYIILAGLEDINESIEFRRIVISKKGFGFGKDSVNLIKQYCFENYNAHRIWLDVFSDNYRAIKLYESQGFHKEGLLRECIKQKGKYFSLFVMSILSREFFTGK